MICRKTQKNINNRKVGQGSEQNRRDQQNMHRFERKKKGAFGRGWKEKETGTLNKSVRESQKTGEARGGKKREEK